MTWLLVAILTGAGWAQPGGPEQPTQFCDMVGMSNCTRAQYDAFFGAPVALQPLPGEAVKVTWGYQQERYVVTFATRAQTSGIIAMILLTQREFLGPDQLLIATGMTPPPVARVEGNVTVYDTEGTRVLVLLAMRFADGAWGMTFNLRGAATDVFEATGPAA